MSAVDLTSDDERDAPRKRRRPSTELAESPEALSGTTGAAVDSLSREDLSMQQAAQVNTSGDNSWRAQLNAERVARDAARASASGAASSSGQGAAVTVAPLPNVTLLTYNVWFNHRLALEERMGAIGDIVVQKGYPTILCLQARGLAGGCKQEMTPIIYGLMSAAPWWRRYTASPPPPREYFKDGSEYYTMLLFRRDAVASAQPFQLQRLPDTSMDRGLQTVTLKVGGASLLAATTHLESPCGKAQMMSAPRVAQFKQALATLEGAGERNVVFAGDMNWLDHWDGAMPLPTGWKDAWAVLRPGEAGYTYDGKANRMLGKPLQSRLDRILVRAEDWVISSIEMVGTAEIPGVTCQRGGNDKVPVRPSDHFGLYAILQPKT